MKWRNLHNEKLRKLYSSPKTIIMIKTRTNGEAEGKPEGKKLLGRPRRRWLDTIKIGLGER
jgi:hypothetical protein